MSFSMRCAAFTLFVGLLGACGGPLPTDSTQEEASSPAPAEAGGVSAQGCYTCDDEPPCGDGYCASGEASWCPEDCDVCGDGVCGASETDVTCLTDCDAEAMKRKICGAKCQEV
jgi:hypothetical protein